MRKLAQFLINGTVTPAQIEHIGQGYLSAIARISNMFNERFNRPPEGDEMFVTASILEKLTTREATDARDRIYGALGLLPSSVNIKPDYSLSVKEVYGGSALHFVKWSQSLNILHLCRNRNEDPYWPSWVPDFRRCSQDASSHWNAAANASCFFVEQGERQLLVHAFIVDDLAITRRDANELLAGDSAVFQAIESQNFRLHSGVLRKAVAHGVGLHCSEIGQSVLLWHVLQQSAVPIKVGIGTHLVPQQELDIAAELDLWLPGNLQPLTTPSRQFLMHSWISCQNRSIWSSRHGRTVITAGEAELGDCVAILAGCAAPMLLRRRPDICKNGYSIVSACFCESTYTLSNFLVIPQ